ncbi:serine/threonine-protein kinase [Archangium lansingense]|uniref:Serine/threonine-protein kinase n=1 Tax=Archangium lansingense TaxID=2995310 RepID=A0ABT4A5P8_9BACT|nr:serine/threonine-protein kinase [Archangium lansinium]MCY1076901.1 serine/threonine-protein kinase [Archangium lansinium]
MTQPAASDIRVGAVLRDTYEITSLLGKGGMGAVFLARHRRLPGKQVAVKVLHNSASLNPELYARFRREAEIASQLGHPNIVEVLDFDTLQDGTPFLVMEYLRGESLEQRLSRGPLPVDAALSITRQVCSALQAAHRAGVVHRDLKPANVFLVPTDSGGVVGERVKLLDFGISKMLDSQTLQTQDAVLIGTPQYMAPEQALGKNSEVDARTDIFALGCIVYELLSGKPPFAGDGGSIVQVVFRIVHGQPDPLASLCPDLPSRVLGAVEKALAKSPQERYPDVGAFIADLTGSPLQSLAGAAVPSFSSSRAASVPSGAADDGGFAATHMPSSTARFGAPAAGAADDGGIAATHMPASTARFGAPAAGPADDGGFAATHMPASTARFGAPAAAAPDDVGFAATHMPASTARMGAPAVAATDEGGFAATHMPSSTARIPAPVVPQPPPASLAPATASPAVAPVPVAVQAPVPQVVPARSGPGMGKLAGAAMLVLALVALGWWFGTRSAPGPVNIAPVPVAAPTPAPTPAPAPQVPAEPKAPVSPEPIVKVEPPVSAATSTSTSTSTSTTVTPSATASKSSGSEAVPEEARELLKKAERALKDGDTKEAIRLARSSQQVKVTPASYSVLTRAYCQQQDLGSAMGKWREGKLKTFETERGKVIKFCKKYGIEFEF